MADWLESFLSMRIHVLIRFGLWQEILSLPLPPSPQLYCFTTTMTHYAKSLAHANTSSISSALHHRTLFHASIPLIPSSRTLFNNTCASLLQIASSMLDGEIAYRQSQFPSAFTHLLHAISLDDSLPYDEPWGWMQPTRHAYGALQLEQGHLEEAMRVYKEDLGISQDLPRASRHPNNVWALHGLHECLMRLGKEGEAEIVGGQLKLAVAVADVEIWGSCFCRKRGGGGKMGVEGGGVGGGEIEGGGGGAGGVGLENEVCCEPDAK